uniref:Uncharacterized protein n=1 Tax=Nothoprocta perdicaria TaxID=30464 RepID=A0A8C6Z794_NOTPE
MDYRAEAMRHVVPGQFDDADCSDGEENTETAEKGEVSKNCQSHLCEEINSEDGDDDYDEEEDEDEDWDWDDEMGRLMKRPNAAVGCNPQVS